MLSLAEEFCDFSTEYKFYHYMLFNLQSEVFSFAFMLAEVWNYLKILRYAWNANKM